MQTLHLRAARYSLYVMFPCLALHCLNEHVIGGDTPCFNFFFLGLGLVYMVGRPLSHLRMMVCVVFSATVPQCHGGESGNFLI